MFGKDRKTLVKSLLEKSTAVCGSIQSTIQDEDNIGWVKSKAEGCSQRSCKKVELDATGFSHEFSELLDEDYSEDFTHETQSTDGGKDKPRVSSSRGKAIGSKMPVDSYGCAGHAVVIGLCLSRRSSVGHADTVTRQTEFDFNELQDRDYKYVSSTDERGWLAGGGQRRDPQSKPSDLESGDGDSDKVAAPDRVHLPIIQINAPSAEALNEIVAALARGEIFIPHMAILPGSLTVKGKSPPDLVVPFGCEKNDDANPEDWPNWCLEFLHNQLYDYFAPQGAQWSKRPFQITLARKVKWKTIKHMNKYFARSEDVTQSWREKGPQYLTPQKVLGVTSEEVLRPHGIYLIRNGEPTNYFPPNFEPPYATNVTRSLIRNVVNKSWDSKHRDWLGEPVPHYRGPIQVISSFIECGNPNSTVNLDVCANDTALVAAAHELSLRYDETPQKEGRKQKREKSPLKEMKPNKPTGRKEKKNNSVDLESVESDPRFLDEEQQNIDDLNRAVDTALRVETTTSEKYSRIKSMRREMRDRRQDLNEERGAREAASPAQQTTMSMTYSMDTASQLRGAATNVNGGDSVISAGTDNPSLFSYVTRSTIEPAKNPGDSTESTVVPSDEELIAIGWAKAFDPNTESYYYFTLDRTKTVWENPLLS